MSEAQTTAGLRQIFLQRHKEWEAVNNPKGYKTGAVKKAWEKRLKALEKLV